MILRNFTPEQRAEAIRRRQSHESVRSIAEHFGVPESSMSDMLRAAGVGRIIAGKITPAMQAEIRRRYHNGESKRAIARALSICEESVGRYTDSSKHDRRRKSPPIIDPATRAEVQAARGDLHALRTFLYQAQTLANSHLARLDQNPRLRQLVLSVVLCDQPWDTQAMAESLREVRQFLAWAIGELYAEAGRPPTPAPAEPLRVVR